MKKTIPSTVTLIIALLLTSCGGTICESKKKKIILNYNPTFKTVDIGGLPTYNERASWVKKLIVKQNGFLVVSKQNIAGLKKVPCEEESKKGQLCQKYFQSHLYQMHYYIEGVGYKYWGDLPKKQWESISNLEDQPSKKPDFIYKNCRFSLLGPVLDIILMMIRA
ncbi:MAG: hypothetical protein OXH36_03380 [Bdellovibrionales bacterium]|nr:hypothetical protein [Bdellovibrionales bacterium]